MGGGTISIDGTGTDMNALLESGWSTIDMLSTGLIGTGVVYTVVSIAYKQFRSVVLVRHPGA